MNRVQISPVFQKQIAQIRSMKPRFYNNDALCCLPPLTRLLFLGLWCKADTTGHLDDKPRTLKKVFMGYDDVTAGQVNDMLQELYDAGLITWYQTDGCNYIQVTDFSKH